MFDDATTSAHRLRAGETTSVALVEGCLRRAEAVNGEINAIVAFADDAIEKARAADERMANGQIDGPLHGLPMTIKDCFDTAGLVSTWGTLGRQDTVPAADATVVKRLKDAGAILIGKTNTPEFTLSFSTYNKIHGFTRNPFDPTRSPGGSSGGAAAALACGMTSFDIGTDFGGSIRVPSHFCGTTGIKPTSGSVSRAGFCLPPGWLMDFMSHVGPMARSVADLALILPVIWGPDSIDSTIASVPFPRHDRVDVRNLRCAVMRRNGLAEPSTETVETVQGVAGLLEEAGLRIRWQGLAGLEEQRDMISGLVRLGGYAFINAAMRAAGTQPEDFANNWLKEPGLADASAQQIEAWRQAFFTISAEELNAHLVRVEDFRRRLLGQMTDIDVLICPVNPTAAPPLPPPGDDPFPDGSYTELFDVTGWPAGVVRAGTTDAGLPIGVQVVANPWREDVVLAVMSLIEANGPTFAPPDLAS